MKESRGCFSEQSLKDPWAIVYYIAVLSPRGNRRFSLGNKPLFFVKWDVSALPARVVPIIIIRIKYSERCFSPYDQAESPGILTTVLGMRRAVLYYKGSCNFGLAYCSKKLIDCLILSVGYYGKLEQLLHLELKLLTCALTGQSIY